MNVGYKTVIAGQRNEGYPKWEVGDTIRKEAHLEAALTEGGVVPCCEKMKEAIEENNILFDEQVCVNVNERWSEGEGSNVGIKYCPFCGEEIVLEEKTRVRMVNRPSKIPARTVDNWVEEEIPG